MVQQRLDASRMIHMYDYIMLTPASSSGGGEGASQERLAHIRPVELVPQPAVVVARAHA